MKIVNRKQFLALPAGTVYQSLYPKGESLEVKGTNCGDNDWIFTPLTGTSSIASTCGNDHRDKMEIMQNGGSVPNAMDHGVRDGMFIDEETFLIYERDDIQRLMAALRQSWLFLAPVIQ